MLVLVTYLLAEGFLHSQHPNVAPHEPAPAQLTLTNNDSNCFPISYGLGVEVYFSYYQKRVFGPVLQEVPVHKNGVGL